MERWKQRKLMGAIDFDKIIVLHNAGWSSTKIADEMRMTEDEYDNALFGVLDATDKEIKRLEDRYKMIVEVIKG